MQITPYATGMAVLRVFRDHRVFHSGGALLLSDITKVWEQTGLRRRDLSGGIEWLRAERCLRLETGSVRNDTVISLMPEGAARLTDFPRGLGRLMDELDGALILRSVARRARPPAFWSRWRSTLHGIHPIQLAS